ncbi:hypothetical protein M422DRAFT_60074 [Sphaerobolus stellatus SS14]|uniref:MFS general substrate transporter n=1 Tax=Sphaerobolus stellatus (strain SS14) TaxID=990650 RepID=A0A0C9UMH9_SPHS4|nr:hypothetical protein M422DRAFT_60074 [Sphaerobolus stellatus SS14]
MTLAIESFPDPNSQSLSHEKKSFTEEVPITSDNQYEEVADDDNYPDGGLRAWLNVLGALACGTATFGFVNSYVFQAYYTDTLLPHVSPSSISWIGSIQYALTFFPALFMGRLFDLGHFRIPMLLSSVSLVVATFLVAECKQYWHFLLCQGITIGISSGILFGPSLGCVVHWFKVRRSLAYAIVACGSSIGGTLFPILVRNLIPTVGFAWTMRILGFILLLLVGVANLTLRRRLPPIHVTGGLFNLRIFKDVPAYSVYTVACFISFLGLLTYIDSSATFYGIDDSLAFYLVAIANASSAVGRIGCGLASRHIGPVNVMTPMTAVAGILTMAWPYARSTGSIATIAVLYGMSSGAFVGLLALPIVSMGQIGDVGRRQGMLFSILAVGAIIGPPISGIIQTATGGYVAVGFYAGGSIMAAAVLLFATRFVLAGSLIGGMV